MPMSPRLLRPRAAGGFDPRAISGLAVWLDAADSASVTLNSGNVAEWRDKSGNGKHMAQSTAANQPAYVATGQNGRGVIRATGSPQHLRRESGGSLLQEDMSFLGVTTHTIFIAAKANARTFANYLYWAINPASTTNSRLQLTGPVASTGTYAIDSGGSSAGTGRLNTTVDAGLSPHIIAFRRSGTDYAAWTNGTASGSATNAGANISFTGTYSLFTWLNAAGASGDGATAFYSGDLYEVLHYNRALTTRERDQVLGYLGQKWGITTTLSNPPSVSNAEASDWIDRVYANGGTVSASTAAAVNTFCNAIDAAGIRDRFYRLNLFCGDQLAAALVPLYRAESSTASARGNTNDTNNGPFVAADFNNTGSASGLKANGTTKFLDTGLPANAMAANNAHLAIGLRAAESRAASFRSAIAAWDGTNVANSSSLELALHSGLSSAASAIFTRFNASSDRFGDLIGSTPGPLAAGDIVATWPTMYRNGVATGATATTSQNYPSAHGLSVFAVRNYITNGVSGYTDARINWYSIGLGMTAAQAAAFTNAVQAFNSTLSRT